MEMYRIPGYTKKVLDWIVPIKSKAKQNKTKTPNQKKWIKNIIYSIVVCLKETDKLIFKVKCNHNLYRYNKYTCNIWARKKMVWKVQEPAYRSLYMVISACEGSIKITGSPYFFCTHTCQPVSEHCLSLLTHMPTGRHILTNGFPHLLSLAAGFLDLN